VGPLGEPGFSTSAFVIYGESDRPGYADVTLQDGSNGFEIVHGNAGEDVFGPFSVGDVTDDDIDDLVVQTLSGLQVVPGAADGFDPEFQLPAFGPANDVEHFYRFDFDFNGDGIPDGITSTSPDSEVEQRIVLGDVGDRSLPDDSYDLTGFDFVEVGNPASGESITGSGSIGDLNGDGFDDAVIAAESSSGVESLYVVFGVATSVKGNQLLGTTEDDQVGAVSSGDAADALIGRAGDDTLIGNGGPDSFFGGPGNDVITVDDVAFRIVDGGSGFDTFVLGTAQVADLDLTTILDRRVVNIEAIDLRDTITNTLTLDLVEALRLSSSSNTVRIFKDVDDVVDMGSGWEKTETITEDWRAFDVYVQRDARLEVQVPIPSVLPMLDGTRGVHLALEEGDSLGEREFRSVGDINGDGLDDLIIRDDGYGSNSKAFYVVFGTDESLGTSFVPARDLNGSNGFAIVADPLEERFLTVHPGGDFNGDGYADLIVLTKNRTVVESRDRQFHIVLGQAEPFVSEFDMSQLDGTNGFSIQLDTDLNLMAPTMRYAGDVNGDGLDDVLFGGTLTLPEDAATGKRGDSEWYLLFGQSGDSIDSFALDEFGAAHGVVVSAIDFDNVISHGKESLQSTDINHDGFADLFFRGTDPDRFDDYAYGIRQFIIYGSEELPERIDLSNNARAVAIDVDHYLPDRLVDYITPVNDVTNDGLDDLLVFTFDVAGGPWEVHTVPGSFEPLAGVLTLSEADARVPEFTGYPYWNTDFDFNGDGLRDSIRSRAVDGFGSEDTVTAIVLGEALGNSSEESVTPATYGAASDDLEGREVIYLASDLGTRSAENIGDFNGDGYDDIAFVDWLREDGVYILFGSSTNPKAVLREGRSRDDYLIGGRVSGLSDLVVGLAGDDTLNSNGGFDTLLGGGWGRHLSAHLQ